MTLRILVAGDGHLDQVSLPPLIESTLGAPVDTEFEPWKNVRLHGKGYGKKLTYLMKRARLGHYHALVGVVDKVKDKRDWRIRKLRQVRDGLQHSADYVATALGRATPHGEAWLLADHVAVQRGLGLPADAAVPSPVDVSDPKATLSALHQESDRRDVSRATVWSDIACEVDHTRARAQPQTGFEEFRAELRQELEALIPAT